MKQTSNVDLVRKFMNESRANAKWAITQVDDGALWLRENKETLMADEIAKQEEGKISIISTEAWVKCGLTWLTYQKDESPHKPQNPTRKMVYYMDHFSALNQPFVIQCLTEGAKHDIEFQEKDCPEYQAAQRWNAYLLFYRGHEA